MDQKPMILDDKKFALYAKPVDGGKGRPKLQFQVYNGNPSIAVFTNHPQDTERRPISARMDARAWSAFIAGLEHVIESKPGTDTESKPIALINNSGPPNKTFTDTTVMFGKSSDGVIWLAVKKNDRPKVKFEISSDIYHDLCWADGTDMSPGDKSYFYAKGFVYELKTQMSALMRETYQPPKPQQGGGGRGGYSGGGNRGAGNSGYSGGTGGGNDFDDDLPM